MKHVNTNICVITAVILSSVIAVAYDLSVMSAPASAAAKVLLAACFVFDLGFSFFFIIGAVKRKKQPLSDIPMNLAGSLLPLVFSSGPGLFILVSGTGGTAAHIYVVWNSLCITGLLRASRLAGLAAFPELIRSPMTARHVFNACRVSVVSCAPAFIIASLAAGYPFYAMHGTYPAAAAALGFAGTICMYLLLSAMLLVYSRGFYRHVARPVAILDRGFRRREFYLRAEVGEEYKNDEIYRLAAFYNDSFLPAKMRQNLAAGEPARQAVKAEDMQKFMDGKKSL